MTLSRQQYFQAIERLFIELRGAPLLLSPSDWQTAKSWHQLGIPLSTVESAVREVFERRDERREADRINSLRYCAPNVAKEWRNLQEIQGPGARSATSGAAEVRGVHGGAREPSVAERLRGLAEALPAELPDLDTWRQRLVSLEGDVDGIEIELQRFEDQLLRTLEERLSEEANTLLEVAVEEGLDRVRERLSELELVRLRERLHRQRLRQASGLPRLTLFG